MGAGGASPSAAASAKQRRAARCLGPPPGARKAALERKAPSLSGEAIDCRCAVTGQSPSWFVWKGVGAES
jgi:hypothetical protein